jgi:protein O-mannosyl-transferase
LSPADYPIQRVVLRPRFIALLLLLGTLAVYLPAARCGFSCYDDGDYVVDNQMVLSGLTWAGVKWAFTTWHASNWHPLTWLSHMTDCQLFGLNPGMHHSVNVLFHAANSLLLLLLLLRWTNAVWPSAFAAALFAWHPLHVESVAWISERKDVLSTFFALLALLAYTKAVTGDEWRVTRKISFPSLVTRHSSRFYWLALLFFALGLLAKPMVVTLPFVMLLLDYWPLQRISNCKSQISNPSARQPSTLNFQLAIVLEKWPFFALAAASCAITFLAQDRGGAMASLQTVPLDYRLENIPVAYVRYLLKMVWPSSLAICYPMSALRLPVVAAALAVLSFISAAVWFGRRRGPYWLVGWLWFLGTLVPVIGLVKVGAAALADRYAYFPSIGLFLAFALSLRDGAERFHVPRTVLATTAAAALAIFAVLTERQVNFWTDDVALFRHAVAVTRDNGVAHLNLGYGLEKEGRKEEAMKEYRLAAQLEPGIADPHNNLANLLDDAGHPEEAIAEFREALRINPRYVAAHDNLGTVFVELGRFDEAMAQYEEAARLAPNDWHAPHLIGKALLKQGRDQEAIMSFRRAMQIAPNNPQVLTYLARVLAADEKPQVRNGNAALAMAAKANDLTGGNQPAMIDVLAMAYAETGDFTNAQESAAYALKLATTYDMTNDVSVIQHRLQLYQNHQPWRESFLATNQPPPSIPIK